MNDPNRLPDIPWQEILFGPTAELVVALVVVGILIGGFAFIVWSVVTNGERNGR